MSATEHNKSEVIRFVCNAKLALDNASQCFVMGELVDLPEAFPVAEKHLHTLRTTFTSIYTKLNAESLDEVYANSSSTTREYCNHIAYVKELFEIVNCPNDDSELKMEKYQRAVQDHKGVGLKKVMLYLINCAMVVAKKPLVTDKQKEALKEAQDEMKGLPPEVYDDNSTGGVAINHHSTGHQFNYSGTGHQNICNSGFQITGNNDRGVYNYLTDPNKVYKS